MGRGWYTAPCASPARLAGRPGTAHDAAMLELLPLPAFTDNYIWTLRRAGDRRVVVVDPGDASPVEAHLAQHGLELAAILVTHHHGDHTGGVAALAARHRVPVHGPAREAQAVVGVPHGDGARLRIAELELDLEVLEIPGHTLGHIAFVGGGVLLCGDTLFSVGCGRLFEGTPAQMLGSLERLAALPPETRVCCGHEYTLANLAFAAVAEPGNAAQAEHAAAAAAARAAGRPTLPSSIGLERAVNPFLRVHTPVIQRTVAEWSGGEPAGKVAAFAALRRWKDAFR
jgi:hydroxyacylglutathione hydrolase